MGDPRSGPVRLVARVWAALAEPRRRVDLALAAVGVAFASVSLAFPFGRDQGLYYFVGREWLRHGEMPYRDTFEQKTPPIFFLHALCIAVFGEHMWSIRVAELGCMVALGLVCARLATPAGERVPQGVAGASVLAAAVAYIGFFDFWNTAQCEIWCTTAAMASCCAALRVSTGLRAALASGLLAGVALAFKPPAAPLVAVGGLALLVRALGDREGRWRRAAIAAVSYGIAATLPMLLLVAYFAAKGALPAMKDVLVGANGYYLAHERGVQSAYDVAKRTHDLYKLWDPLGTLLLEVLVVGLVVGVVRRDRELRDRHALALCACVAAFVGVLSQLKFYMYHWGMIVGPGTLVAANVVLDAVRVAAWRIPSRSAAIAPSLFALNLFAAFALTGRCANKWLEEASLAVDRATGKIDEEEFSRGFDVEALNFRFHDGEQVAFWLRDHTSPADEVAVRGFEPEIYAVAGRRYGGRFFWTSFLTDPRRAYRREEWLAQDRADLVARRPRWIVALTWVREGPDAPALAESLGYLRRHELYGFTILERSDVAAAP
jgi:hypothetical protein